MGSNPSLGTLPPGKLKKSTLSDGIIKTLSTYKNKLRGPYSNQLHVEFGFDSRWSV